MKLKNRVNQVVSYGRAYGKDIEGRVVETFKNIEAQEFLQKPFFQDLMKRVRSSMQKPMEQAVEAANEGVHTLVDVVENAVDRVENVMADTAEQVFKSVRQGQKSLGRSMDRHLDTRVAKKGAASLVKLQRKLAESILERAESVRQSLSKENLPKIVTLSTDAKASARVKKTKRATKSNTAKANPTQASPTKKVAKSVVKTPRKMTKKPATRATANH